ncbi:MAG: type VI secretion system baseplate subunit TssE [Bryobacterales bacterium]|nr:type VI secretion system baseplate subunit TssE [Bryobacterales bacterium]
MARTELEFTVTQTVLDRLIDREPQAPADPSMTRAQSVRNLKASLRRDLEWLLNTRRTPEAVDESYPELYRSLFNFGLPDVTSISVDSPRDRNRLLRAIEKIIEIFEPRLDAVRVTALENTNAALLKQVRFQVEGLLKMDPAPELISFDTVLSLTSGEYQVQGDRGAR